jgi:hypothetical protein
MRMLPLKGVCHNACLMFLLCLNSSAAPLEQPRSNGPARGCDELKAVFTGFVFVGENSCREVEYRDHGTTPLPAPETFRENICYFYLAPLDSDNPVYEILESRLRTGSATLLHSPSINHDAIHLVVGGPLFRINFRKGTERGVIEAIQAPAIAGDESLRRHWRSEYFVLRFGN